MSRDRPRRVESLLRELVSDLFLHERLNDPRLHGRLTVTDVEVSRDLRHAKFYVSHLGSEEQEKEIFQALASATGFVQSCIARGARLRYTPRVSFAPDHSIERGVRLVHKINSLRAVGGQPGPDAPTDTPASDVGDTEDAEP